MQVNVIDLLGNIVSSEFEKKKRFSIGGWPFQAGSVGF